MLTIRRGTARRWAIAVAATASGGETIAPSATASGHVMPGTRAIAAAATTPALAATRPTARDAMFFRLVLKSRIGVRNALTYRSGGSTTRKTISGSSSNRGIPGTSPTTSPPSRSSTGYGTRIFRETVTSAATITRRATSSTAVCISGSARYSVLHAAFRHRQRIENATQILLGHDLRVLRHVEERAPFRERLLDERRCLGVADVRRERGHGERRARIHELLRAVLVHLEPGDRLFAQDAHGVREDGRRETVREVDARHHHVELELPGLCAVRHRGVVADHLEAHLIHHLRYRWVDLARHDRGARLHRGDAQLAETGARPGHEQADVVADARHLDRRRSHAARDADERRHRLHRREEILRGLDRLAVPLGQIRAHALAKLRVGVEAGARGRAADAELAQLRAPRAKSRRRAAHAFGPAREFLTERDRHRVLQVGPAGLHAVGVARGLLGDRVGERVELRAERLRELERPETHRGGRRVVRRLGHIHVVVWVHVLVGAEAAAQDLVRAVGEDLVHVHVKAHARAGVEYIDNELIHVLSGEDLIARREDGVLAPFVETPSLAVRKRGGPLDPNEAADEIGRAS